VTIGFTSTDDEQPKDTMVTPLYKKSVEAKTAPQAE
jgi:hypothetical protein